MCLCLCLEVVWEHGEVNKGRGPEGEKKLVTISQEGNAVGGFDGAVRFPSCVDELVLFRSGFIVGN